MRPKVPNARLVKCLTHLAPGVARCVKARFAEWITDVQCTPVHSSLGVVWVEYIQRDGFSVTYHERRVMRAYAEGVADGLCQAGKNAPMPLIVTRLPVIR